jgi:hypothetical protein
MLQLGRHTEDAFDPNPALVDLPQVPQFTCFTGTKVQILTLRASPSRSSRRMLLLSLLLALLVQKYKY